MATAGKVVFFSASPFGTGDIKTGAPTLTISSGVATLTVAQTGNIGAGCEIDFGASNTKVYIAPCRIAYNSGSTEIKIHDKIRGITSGAVGIVRAVELTSGSWAGGDAAGYIYFRKVTGTFNSSENLNRVRPTASSNIATTNGSLQGNMSTTFIVKDPDGTETANEGSAQTVNSIHHVASSLDGVDAIYTGANYINNTNFTAAGADIVPYICGYYDHDDQTLDTTNLTMTDVTVDLNHYVYFYTPQGDEESINNQRHDGTPWNTNKYIIETTSNSTVILSEFYTRFKGFQVHQNGDSGSHGIESTVNTVYIGNNIVRATISGGDTQCYGIYLPVATCRIWNNVIYDWINGSKLAYGIYVTSGPNYIYNNTVHNCYSGIKSAGGGSNLIKNNVSQDCDGSYSGTWVQFSTHNIGNGAASELAFGEKYKTGQADDTAASKLKDADAQFITNGVKVGCVVKNTTDTTYTRVTALDGEGQLSLNDDIFVSGENYEVYTSKIGDVTFNNEGADDFHLGAGDSFAKNLGTNLSADAGLPFWDDIDGDERL